jgi:hypothetical protein
VSGAVSEVSERIGKNKDQNHQIKEEKATHDCEELEQAASSDMNLELSSTYDMKPSMNLRQYQNEKRVE